MKKADADAITFFARSCGATFGILDRNQVVRLWTAPARLALASGGALPIHPDDKEALKSALGRIASAATNEVRTTCRMLQHAGTYATCEIAATAMPRGSDGPIAFVIRPTGDTRTQEDDGGWNHQVVESLNHVTHEMGNPLSALRISLSVAQKSLRRPELLKTTFERMQRSLDRIVRVTEDLQDVAKLKAGGLRMHPREVNLATLMKAAAEGLEDKASRKGMRLDILPKDLEVTADPDRVIQVLTNLLDNAIKFTPPGGHVEATASRLGRQALVAVRDTGRGLTADEIPLLFRPFSQVHDPGETNVQGTGLGLVISKGLVNSHGGDLWVESEGRGSGSRFFFTLPLSE